MKNSVLLILILVTAFSIPLSAQEIPETWISYEPSEENPYGMKNPDAPQELDDFKPMIGTCACKSLRRAPDGSWADTVTMYWSFKYVLNGTAIQDNTWSANSSATSIRTFHPDSAQWVVSYASFPGVTTTPSTWIGQKEGENIILGVPQKAPNGMDGISRLTFTNIRNDGFDWRGEWVNDAQGIVYPFWLIWCEKMDDD